VKAARGPIVLHLATHGFFLGTHESGDRSSGADWRSDHQTEDPLLRSALLFAGVKALRSGELANWGRKPAILEIGNFDGYIDEVVVRCGAAKP